MYTTSFLDNLYEYCTAFRRLGDRLGDHSDSENRIIYSRLCPKKIFFEVIAFYIILTITVGMCISNASDYRLSPKRQLKRQQRKRSIYYFVIFFL